MESREHPGELRGPEPAIAEVHDEVAVVVPVDELTLETEGR
jgi:hypothetical protein